MQDYQNIYRHHPDRYQELVAHEDADGNLAPALDAVHGLAGADVLEVGAGTGRITRLLLREGVRRVLATDAESAMLEQAERSLGEHGNRIRFEVADARSLPAPNGSVDLAVAGWVFGHFRHWMPDDWRRSVGAALDEMERVTRRGGHLVVIETLGTGSEEPNPPNPALAEYYAWLETERGLSRRSIRTDYRFASVEDAARITGFFFGDDFATRVREERWTTVPECTGLWFRTR